MEQKQSKSLYYWVGGIVAILLIGGFIYFNRSSKTDIVTDNTVDTNPTSSMIYPYGTLVLKLGETGNFRGISITPLKIEEDSRCAKGVQCVWAGTVKVSIKSDLDSGESIENMITLGNITKIDTFAVGLVAVTPETTSGTKITDVDYRLTFDVHQSTVVDDELIGK